MLSISFFTKRLYNTRTRACVSFMEIANGSCTQSNIIVTLSRTHAQYERLSINIRIMLLLYFVLCSFNVPWLRFFVGENKELLFFFLLSCPPKLFDFYKDVNDHCCRDRINSRTHLFRWNDQSRFRPLFRISDYERFYNPFAPVYNCLDVRRRLWQIFSGTVTDYWRTHARDSNENQYLRRAAPITAASEEREM